MAAAPSKLVCKKRRRVVDGVLAMWSVGFVEYDCLGEPGPRRPTETATPTMYKIGWSPLPLSSTPKTHQASSLPFYKSQRLLGGSGPVAPRAGVACLHPPPLLPCAARGLS